MTIKEGDKLPDATFMHMTADGPAPITSSELFSGKKVALFAVPGAFTPTCSAQHLPSYVTHHDALKAKGIDTIACVAVNDAFVMGAWGEDRNVGDKILMLADGNAEFSKAIGLELDASGFGLGIRCQRYSMIVDVGVVTKLNTDAPMEYKASSAEYMLEQL